MRLQETDRAFKLRNGGFAQFGRAERGTTVVYLAIAVGVDGIAALLHLGRADRDAAVVYGFVVVGSVDRVGALRPCRLGRVERRAAY